MTGSTALGYVLQFTASLCTSLSYVLQKRAHVGGSSSGSVYCTLPWACGFLLLCIAAGLNLWSYSMLPQVALASFGAATLILNLFLSRLLLKEQLAAVDGAAAVLVTAGTIAALSAVGPSTPSRLSDLVSRLHAPSAVAYICLSICGGAAAAVLVERAPRAALPPSLWLTLVAPVLGGAAHSLVAFASKGIAAALFGADVAAAARQPAAWLFLCANFALLAVQLRYLNVGLSAGSAVRVVPLFQASLITLTAIAGVCLCGDLQGQPAAQQAQFAGGLLVTVGGVALLALKGQGGEGKEAHQLLLGAQGSATDAPIHIQDSRARA